MLEDFRIDRARPEDIPAIMELERSGFIPEIWEAEEVFRARMATFPEGFLVLRESAGTPVRAYLCAERWAAVPPAEVDSYALGHDPLPRHAADGPVLYLASMTIHPELRGSGLGARFFRESRERIFEACPGIEHEVLVVNDEWRGARRIYEREGFSVSAYLIGFFPAGEGRRRAAVLMERPA